MAVEEILAEFEGKDFVPPRLIRTNRSFNNEGTSLYYYVHGKDSDGLIAGLKLDFFKDIRFSNFKKPHPTEEYRPYFDKFRYGLSCSNDDILQRFVSSDSVTKAQLEKMARHWEVSIEQFINTLLLAYMLLQDAEDNGWLDSSDWDGGNFRGSLPSAKR
ncbi:hypothetical protein [Leptolyngbya sp. NIES-2104]|uniref:hypothetical protein n=1 Tax=Leptolyngbya sp. NIES-2104 TaxID=1552121 RepID=UPI00073F6B2F|nr:hypothetical protein [Leptolyngbya sp. NIES-2104]